MTQTDSVEWVLLDSDLTTQLAILPTGQSHLYFAMNEPGSGELRIPLNSVAAGLVTSGMFCQASYRGSARGGFFVENITKNHAGPEEGDQWIKVSGRGPLALFEDAIVWTDGSTDKTRDFSNLTQGSILNTLLTEAQTRGALSSITWDFDAALDSNGDAWAGQEVISLNVGMKLLELLRQFAQVGTEFLMEYVSGGFVFHAYASEVGTDKSDTIFFRVGSNCVVVESDERGDAINNALLVAYKSGSIALTDTLSIATRRRREKLLDLRSAQTSSSASTYGAAILESVKDPRKGISVKLTDTISPHAFLDYVMGDYITLDIAGVEARYRVLGIQCDFGQDQYATVVVELNSLLTNQLIDMSQELETLLDQWTTSTDAGLQETSFFGTLATTEAGIVGITGTVYALCLHGDYLYVGGSLTRVGGLEVTNIARYHTGTGVWSGMGDTSDFASVQAICEMGGDIFVVGNWETSPDAYEHAPVRKWNGSSWAEIGDVAYDPILGSHGGQALATDGTNLYLGGDFINNISGASILSTVAKWNGGSWSAGGSVTDADTLECHALAWFDGKLYGGFIPNISGVGHGLQVRDGAWVNVEGTLNDEVFALAPTSTRLIVGHEGQVYAYTPGDGLDLLGQMVDAGAEYVLALGTYLEDIYVGGEFAGVDTALTGYNTIAKYSGGIWTMIGQGLERTTGTPRCYAIAADANRVFFAGKFDKADGKSAGNICGWFTTFEEVANYLENANSSSFDMGAAIHNATASAVTDSDEFPFWEDVANALRKITWANIKATLKTYFDTLYVALTGDQTVAGVKTFTGGIVVDAPAKISGVAGNSLLLQGGDGAGATPGGTVSITGGATGTSFGGDVDISGGVAITDGGGGSVYVHGGNGVGDSSGGDADIYAGDGVAAHDGGDATLTAGNQWEATASGGVAGNVVITAGSTNANDAGKTYINGGSSLDSGAGGNVEITGGASWSGNGGDVVIAGGDSTTGADGAVKISSAQFMTDANFQGYKAIAMACDSGSTLPATPNDGQWFLHSPAGRSVLMQYVGGSWSPIIALGALTIYVDPLGTDSQDKGYGTGADAYLTYAYAWSQIPPSGNGTLTIHIGAGTFAEQMSNTGKAYSTITINGTLSSIATGTNTAVVKGGSQTRGQITDSLASFTPSALKGKQIDPGDGGIRLIYDNDATNIYTVSPLLTTVAIGSTYTVYDYGTVMENIASSNHNILAGKGMTVAINKIKFSGTTFGGRLLSCEPLSNITVTNCSVEPLTKALCDFFGPSNQEFYYTFLATNNVNFNTSTIQSTLSFQGCYILDKTKLKNKLGLYCTNPGITITAFISNTFEGWSIAIPTNGTFQQNTFGSGGANFFIDNNFAIQLGTSGNMVTSTALPYYSGNTKNVSYAWQLGETTLSKQTTSDGGPVLTVMQGASMQAIKAQTASIGETKSDVQGDGRKIYNVQHITEGIESPNDPNFGDIWIDTQ